jgi:cytochrome c biogenesis protein CcmG/thiol:disulfide interchange protein DsbE
MKRALVIPLLVFFVLVGFLYVGLTLDPHDLPSPLVGKDIPQFQLTQLKNPQATFSNSDLAGKVTLVNAWASWCVTCRQEHQLLMNLAKQNTIAVFGINYKDERGDALAYLQQLGDPYVMNGHDLNGRVGIEWGIIATPESFLVDKRGVIRYKVNGMITTEAWTKTIEPLITQLNKEPS